jgi:hypothetical protein
MPRHCATCTHPRLAEINQRIVKEDVSIRELAKEFCLPKSTLQNHKNRCMPAGREQRAVESIKAIVAANPRMSKPNLARAILPEREELVGQYMEIANRLDVVAQEAEAAGSRLYTIQALANMKTVLDSIAKLAGHTYAPPQVHLSVRVDANTIAAELASRINTIDGEAVEELALDDE